MNGSAGWSAPIWCLVIGGLLVVNALGFGVFVVRRGGKRRRMTQEELTQSILRDDITDMPTYSVSGPGVGVKIEASATTDTLRDAAARGDWAVFWSWPIFMVSWTMGAQLVITAFALAEHFIFIAVFCGFLLVPAAIAWIYKPLVVLFGKPPAEEDDSIDIPKFIPRR